MAKKYNIINASACYTGGNIYLFAGKTEEGFFYFDLDGFCEVEDIPLFSRAISIEEKEDGTYDEVFYDFEGEYNRYGIGYVSGSDAVRLVIDTLAWIIQNKPEGNYAALDIRDMLFCCKSNQTKSKETAACSLAHDLVEFDRELDPWTFCDDEREEMEKELYEKLLNGNISNEVDGLASLIRDYCEDDDEDSQQAIKKACDLIHALVDYERNYTR